MRDAQSLLDQIISFGGQKVADEDVRDVLGFIPSEILDQTIVALAEHNSKALLDTIDTVINQGLNIQQYVREFIACLRDLLLMRLDLDAKVLGSVEEKATLKQHSARFSEQDLIRYFDLALRLENDLRYTGQPRFHLEVGFIKLAKIGQLRDIEEVISELRQGKPPVPSQPAPPQRMETPQAKPAPPPPQAPSAPPASFKDSFIRRAEERSATTAVYLQKAAAIERTDNGVQIVMPNSTYLAGIDTKEHRAVIEAVATELIGKAVSVSLIIKGQESPGRSQTQASPGAIESAREEPLVKKFLEVFRGDLAQVKPIKES